jgi:exodeoxyribonuclease VII small subunit
MAAATPTGSDDAPDFEASLEELEALVDRLEQGDLPLEEALRTFERGVALTRTCHAALATAQQKVEILLAQGGAAGERRVREFDTGAADDSGDE